MSDSKNHLQLMEGKFGYSLAVLQNSYSSSCSELKGAEGKVSLGADILHAHFPQEQPSYN